MTEADWKNSTDPAVMLVYLRDTGSDRKFRLFACACCRRIWDRFPDPANRDLVAAVEDHPEGNYHRNCFGEAPADGIAPSREIEVTAVASSRREREFAGVAAYWVAKYMGRGFYKMSAAESASWIAAQVETIAARESSREAERELPFSPEETERTVQVGLLHEIFGNPFRPTPPLTAGVVAGNDGILRQLAQTIYGERGFDRLPILADALEDAGCTDADLLSHFRGPGPHVRGCWALDAILGKS